MLMGLIYFKVCCLSYLPHKHHYVATISHFTLTYYNYHNVYFNFSISKVRLCFYFIYGKLSSIQNNTEKKEVTWYNCIIIYTKRHSYLVFSTEELFIPILSKLCKWTH